MGHIRRSKGDKERKIQDALIQYLKVRQWLVERLIGNAYQRGIPDLYVYHPDYGYRWIDVKVEGEYSFTQAQKIKWPIWEHFGVGIWILTGANQTEYNKLFHPPNWRNYWKASWKLPDVAALIEELYASETDEMDVSGD